MSWRSRRAALIALLAIAGLALAIGLAVLTSSLTTQHVGLAGEPPRPARLVAPARGPARTVPTVTKTTTTTTTVPAGSHGGDDGSGDD